MNTIFPRPREESFIARGPNCGCPFYLDAKLQHQLEQIAEKTGKELGEIVNHLVKKEVELLEELS